MDAELKTLLQEIEEQKALMVSVATGGPQIKDKNAEYSAIHDVRPFKVNALEIGGTWPHQERVRHPA